MTENEAKTKWCPFVRAVEAGDRTWANKPLSGEGDMGEFSDEKTRCIASACMAWRWDGYVGTDGKHHRILLDDETGLGSGYCGLAGEPR